MLLDLVRISIHHGIVSKFHSCLKWIWGEFVWDATLVDLRRCQTMDTKISISSNSYNNNRNNVTDKQKQLFLE